MRCELVVRFYRRERSVSEVVMDDARWGDWCFKSWFPMISKR
ncbi:Protein of unknown function [Pyronema omphalodes CBS 100304]|uniref:Uncharacterized protein n=1 Tax=Pyronema omphalodes (strain CBS 100304) TaxID=1076935 RepID=U4KZZ4_PYROM|nr:Protein of unknown function [Pyronema omphalodes CBS 100304]